MIWVVSQVVALTSRDTQNNPLSVKVSISTFICAHFCRKHKEKKKDYIMSPGHVKWSCVEYRIPTVFWGQPWRIPQHREGHSDTHTHSFGHSQKPKNFKTVNQIMPLFSTIQWLSYLEENPNHDLDLSDPMTPGYFSNFLPLWPLCPTPDPTGHTRLSHIPQSCQANACPRTLYLLSSLECPSAQILTWFTPSIHSGLQANVNSSETFPDHSSNRDGCVPLFIFFLCFIFLQSIYHYLLL